jgi:hypothetical protein
MKGGMHPDNGHQLHHGLTRVVAVCILAGVKGERMAWKRKGGG